MIGDLPRASSAGRGLKTRRTWRRAVAPALGAIVLCAGSLCAADVPQAVREAGPAEALRQVSELRRLTACLAAPTDDLRLDFEFRGRKALEIKGRERVNGAPGTIRDFAVFDLAAARIVSYVCFSNASTRQSGEAIVSLAEVSGHGDKLARAIANAPNLELESIKRHRAGGTESVYYEARYASASGEFPFLDPPVRLLLNASTGSLFRMDLDPDWLDPPAPPRVRISGKAAERIAAAVLGNHDLAPAFGSGAVVGKVAAAEMYTVHPNDWLGLFSETAAARARVAWVVPFRVNGGLRTGLHSLFVDAGTGLPLGGLFGQ